MIRNRPTTAELLAAARRKLLDDLLPLLPEAQRYDALLVAAAMRVAIAEQEAGPDWQHVVGRDLARLYDEDPDAVDGAAATRLYARLARDIRAGAFDAPGARRNIARAILRAVAHHKLTENNPKYPR